MVEQSTPNKRFTGRPRNARTRPRPNTGNVPRGNREPTKSFNPETPMFNLNTSDGYKRYLDHMAMNRAWRAAGQYEWAEEAAKGSSKFLSETSTSIGKLRNPMYTGVSSGGGGSNHVRLQDYVDRGYSPERLAKLLDLDLQAVDDNLSGLNVMPKCYVASRVQ
jgi:hypothetical protein